MMAQVWGVRKSTLRLWNSAESSASISAMVKNPGVLPAGTQRERQVAIRAEVVTQYGRKKGELLIFRRWQKAASSLRGILMPLSTPAQFRSLLRPRTTPSGTDDNRNESGVEAEFVTESCLRYLLVV